jgi:hypothetical protein
MKKSIDNIFYSELTIIVIMSLISGYALLGSLFFIPFGILLILGIIMVFLLPNLSFIFSFAAGLVTLPALMKLNSVKWWLFSPDRLKFCPTLNLPLALTIGLLVVSGGILLSYLQPLYRELRIIQKEKERNIHSREYARKQNITATGIILVSGFAAAIVVIILDVVRGNLTDWLKTVTWALPVIGITSIVVLALVVFWLAGLRKSS